MDCNPQSLLLQTLVWFVYAVRQFISQLPLGLLGLVCQLVTLVLLALLSTRVCWHYLREAIEAGFFCHATNLSEPKTKLSSVAPLCEASKYTCHGRVVKTPRNDELMSISKNANVLFSQNEFIEVNPNLVLVIMLVCCS